VSSAEERWAQRMEWAEERRRGFDRCEEWDCGCWESHADHIEAGEFNVKHCESCQDERCEGCRGTGSLGSGEEYECAACKGSGAIKKRTAEPPDPDYDDQGD
jgi:hypothetical protein